MTGCCRYSSKTVDLLQFTLFALAPSETLYKMRPLGTFPPSATEDEFAKFNGNNVAALFPFDLVLSQIVPTMY